MQLITDWDQLYYILTSCETIEVISNSASNLKIDSVGFESVTWLSYQFVDSRPLSVFTNGIAIVALVFASPRRLWIKLL